MDEKYKKNNNLDKYDCLELNSAEDVKGVVRLVVQEIADILLCKRSAFGLVALAVGAF